MFSNKKKGQILENKFAKKIMRFVFVFLSFFFVLTGKSFAEKIEYKYIFDAGDGHKFVYTVEEETSYQVTNPNRYTIVNKELDGYSNYVVDALGKDSDRLVYIKDEIGCDLSQDSQKTLYNWCTFLHRTTNSTTSRKLMKAFVIMYLDAGYDVKLADSGNEHAEVDYIRSGVASANAKDATQDNDFQYFWYYDRYFLDCDFKECFDSTTSEKTPYNRDYVSTNHIYLKNTAGENVSLYEKLKADKTMFCYINQSIESGTQVGEYFKAMKVPVNKEPIEADQLVWWYKEGSYDENEKSILVDCAKNVGDTPLFTFKYSATGEQLEEPPYILESNEGSNIQAFRIFEYRINISDDASGNSIYVYPDFTGGSKKTCKNKINTTTNPKSQTGQFYLACNGISYAQTGVQYIYVTDFLPENCQSSNIAGYCYGDKVCTIPTKDLNEIIIKEGGKLDDGLLIKENNGYVFAYDKTTGNIQFFKKDDPAEINYTGMNMNLKKMYAPFEDSPIKNVYGISLKADPNGRTKTSHAAIWKRYDYESQMRLNVLTTANNRVVYNEQNERYTIEWSLSERKNAMFFNLYEDANIDCYLSVRDMSAISEGYRGDSQNTTIPVDKCPVIAEVSIRDWLEIEYKEETEEASEHAKQTTENDSLVAALKSIEDTREEMVPFIEMLFRYARPIILFLILVSICLTAIYSILNHGDPEKRLLVKVRLKNIMVGIVMFSACALVVALCIEYFDKASDLMFAEEKSMDLNIVSPYSMDKNWLLKIIFNTIGTFAAAAKWVIDFLATRMLRLDQREVDLASCIFGVENGGGVTLYPFEEKEWQMYMFGYQMLSILAVAFIAVAIVKNIIMILIGAGNSEKMTLIKQDFLRIFISIVCIVIVPYCVRLLLTITNNLVLLVPVSTSMFNLDFSEYKDIEDLLNLIYYIIELKVYLAFTVRKVMIAFLLIATPTIFGIWAISDKFRSFNLWLGEMLTNIFMQFTYAFAFFFLVMVISNTRNQVVILMMLTMLIKLADFVKDSLQGLFNQWGGINETGIAEEAFHDIAGAPAKVWGATKNAKNKLGKNMMKASKKWDSTGTNRGAKAVHNAGAVLTGNFGALRTEKDRLESIKKLSDSTKGKALRRQESSLTKQIEANLSLTGDVNVKQLYNKVLEGNLSQEEIKNMKKAGGVLGDIAELATVKNDIKEHDKALKEIDKSIDKLDGLSSIRGSVSKDVLNKLKDESKLEKNNVADIYEHTLDDFDRLEDKMNDSLEKLSNPEISDEDKTKEENDLKHILEQVIDKAEIISEVSVELNMTGGAERMQKIRNAQSSAVREKANRFDKELKTEAMDSIQTTEDNLEILENRTKDGANAPKDISVKKQSSN